MDLGPVDHITIGAVGPPGERVFYLQARAEARVISLLVEKEQVVALSQAVFEVVRRASLEPGKPLPEEAMALVEPVEADWRAGRIALGFDSATEDFVLQATEQVAEDDDLDLDDDEGEEEALGGEFASDIGGGLGGVESDRQSLSLRATANQMLSLANHTLVVAARGRPRCPLCGNPMHPDGAHWCPGKNGHRELGAD